MKQRIIKNASERFFSNGIKSVTMSDIAIGMGISKRTLYEIFNDKDELLEHCIFAHAERTDRELASITEKSDNVIDTLLHLHSKLLSATWYMARSVVHDMRKYHRPLYDRLEARQHQKISSFIPLFEKGVRQGLIRNDIPFEILLFLLKRQFKTLMEDENLPTDRYPLSDCVNAMTLTFIRGIATSKGNNRIDEIIDNKLI
ncbi:MAG: TetR/AcrR family transcriptional regulator [Dysgonamonadaceae bacterium]|nr:TetR/AcrR family transcriptional regulator [Dysgonamonadaceae bacterium]